ncbi:MAG: ribosome-binding factor A [Candidatus Babeliales bacterium]
MFTRSHHIKRERKKSLFFKTLSTLFVQKAQEVKIFQHLFLTKVEFSKKSSSTCTLFFYSTQGEDHFNKALKKLITLKGWFRSSISSIIQARNTPELKFKFDTLYEKQKELDTLLSSIAHELH